MDSLDFLLRGIISGQSFLVVEDRGRKFMSYPMENLYSVLQEITISAPVIFNDILFNYNMSVLRRKANVKRFRYLEWGYVCYCLGHGSIKSEPLFLMEPLRWDGAGVNEKLILWQGDESLRLVLLSFGEYPLIDKGIAPIVLSGLKDNGEPYHLFIAVSQVLHPEMANPIIVGCL